jgi:hypothetical protein
MHSAPGNNHATAEGQKFISAEADAFLLNRFASVFLQQGFSMPVA